MSKVGATMKNESAPGALVADDVTADDVGADSSAALEQDAVLSRRLRMEWRALPGQFATAPRRVLVGLTLVAVIVLLLGGFLERRNADAETVESARSEALHTGTSTVETLLSYDYRDIDEAVAERSDLVTGEFGDKYARLIKEQVAPAATKQKVVTRTEVVSASVIDATEDRVNLLVFLNQVSAKKGSDVPVLSGSRVRVEVRLIDGSWRVSAVDPV